MTTTNETPKSKTPLTLPTAKVAKSVGMTTLELNRYLRRKGVLCKNGGIYHLTEEYEGKDYARYKTKVVELSPDHTISNDRLRWTQEGRQMIYDLLKADGRDITPKPQKDLRLRPL